MTSYEIQCGSNDSARIAGMLEAAIENIGHKADVALKCPDLVNLASVMAEIRDYAASVARRANPVGVVSVSELSRL